MTLPTKPRMKPKRRRMIILLIALVIMAVSATIILRVFRDNLMYFYTPSMLDEKRNEETFDRNRPFRLGGMVEKGSLTPIGDAHISFIVEDGTSTYRVEYEGLLPTLFREGQGVVLVGILREDGVVEARTILAKHDENYMPPEVAEALKASGRDYGKKD